MSQTPDAGAEEALRRLDETLGHLGELFDGRAPADDAPHDGWTAKDVLGHITFWHESFARNVLSIVEGRAPATLKGTLVELNRRSVDEARTLTTAQVLARLRLAHWVIQENILSERLVMIPYRKGSRDYAPVEHLEVVNRHIAGHINAMAGARRVT